MVIDSSRRCSAALISVLMILGAIDCQNNAPHAMAQANLFIDFTRVIHTLAPTHFGVTISGYGQGWYITNSDMHRRYLQQAGIGSMKIELQYARAGDDQSALECGGIGCAHGISGDAWVTAIKELGAVPTVILPLDGRHPDSIDLADALHMLRHFHSNGSLVKRFILGNELDNTDNPKHMSAAEYSRRFNMIYDALKAVDRSIQLGGPAVASYNIEYIDTFLANSGMRADFIDFHHYGEGDSKASDAQLLGPVLDSYTNQLLDLQRRINAAVPSRASKIDIQVGEFNLGSTEDPRQLSHFNTVWAAAALGNILQAGGIAVQYADKNGALGMTSEAGEGGISVNEPLPILHAFGMFSGEGLFPSFGIAMVETHCDTPGVRIFASKSRNIVIVNTLQSEILTSIALHGATTGSAELWQSTPTRGWPHQAGLLPLVDGRALLSLPARSVTTVVIK